MSSNTGRFIVVEGLEGAGKSTALRTIKRFLSQRVSELVTTREPGGTHVGETVRSLIKVAVEGEALDSRAELLLLYAARVQLLQQVILPTLERGGWVLADRFELSTYAYQGGGRGLNIAMIREISSFCVGNLQPDLTIFLDIKPHLGLQRAYKRGITDRIEQESLNFFNKVYQAYHAHIAEMSHVVVIDASQTLKAVQQEIITSLENWFERQ